ncbi:MAG TPA: TetR family transcriptional regulator [Gemmatimonadales bacterium]|nr:TetR family transcriptional regulator [Gemmatimonadales bacterium]
MLRARSPRSGSDPILEAAEDLFAQQGFGPTTIQQIGAAAKQNPALIYYYFGSKEKLYHAVLQRLVSGMIERGGAAFDAATRPADAIRGLVRAQVEFLLSHPNAPKLLVRELVDHDARRAQDIILQVAAGLFERLCTVIEQGQRDGSFRREVEPRFAAVSTIAQVVYFMIARPAIGIFFGEGTRGVSRARAREFGGHAGEFAVRALALSEGG